MFSIADVQEEPPPQNIAYIVWGIHVTKWRGTRRLLLYLAPHQVGLFRISRFVPDETCSNKAQSTRKFELFLMV